MTQRSMISLKNAVSGLRGYNKQMLETIYKKTLEFYVDKLIIKHFLGNYGRRQGWRPNSPEYQAWKRKRYGNMPQLVLTSRLKREATRGKAVKRGTKYYVIRWSGTASKTYGIIQKRLGRDWALPSKRDDKDMLRFYKRELKRLRSKSAGIRMR